MMKKHSFTTEIKNKKSSLMWNYRIEVPFSICEEIIATNSKGNEKRVFCQLNNDITFQCALTPDGNGNFYVIVNKENRKKAKIGLNENIQVKLWKDDSTYGISLPVEMETLLAQDEVGNILFHKLTPGKQRSLLHIVGKPKNENIRIRKAITILEYLKSVNGKLDFKELNEAFKMSSK